MRRPSTRSTGRQSQPTGFRPDGKGGGYVVSRGAGSLYGPHSGLGACDLSTGRGIERLVATNPLRLLKWLADFHPSLDYALHNLVTLSCAPGDLSVSAVVDGPNGEQIDEQATQAVESLWRLPGSEFGGLYGLQRLLTREAALTGLAIVETVPGRRGQGLAGIYPIDSLTIGFRRDDEGVLIPRQKQAGGTLDGFVDLSPETTFHRAFNAGIDDPYGRSRFASGLSECLADIAMLKDVRDAIHLTGNPRYTQSFPLQEMIRLAMLPLESETEGGETGFGMTFEQANEFAEQEFAKMQATAGELLSDDVWFFVKGGEINILDGAKGMQGLEKIAILLRQRVSQGLKTPGTLLGISDGSTDTFSSKELEIYAASLESDRGQVAEILYEAAALHLRLIGSSARPKITTKPIRATDALVAAETTAALIENEFKLVQAGMRSEDDASKRLTGSVPADPDKAAAYFALTASTTQPTETTARTPVSFARA